MKLPSDDGNSVMYVKGGLSIFLLYVAALTIRIAINFLFIGSEKLYFNNQQSILGNGTATDIIPMVHIYAAHYNFLASKSNTIKVLPLPAAIPKQK